MDKASVTNELSTLLAGRKVVAGVFTTYNFEPEFFELDVIPELLKKGIPYSTDERVKIFQVREALRESNLALDVFFDLQIVRNSAERSPEMEYLCHGVNSGNSAFHAKNIYLLVEDEDNKQQSLLVAAGSNNITRSGWWRNIEVQHWEEVKSGKVQTAFLNRLRNDVTWLKERRSSNTDSALGMIETYLEPEQCKGSDKANVVNYYPLEEKNLFSFLKNKGGKKLSKYSNWNLEIISPYFAESSRNNLHTDFFKLGVKNITMLLPFDHEESALCEQEYYEHINDSAGIEWGCWKPNIAKALGLGGDSFRRLHAKIYHFYNGLQAWAFVGSVNFSYKAMKAKKPEDENTESGFFVRLPSPKAMLEPLSREKIVETFKPPLDDESGANTTSDGVLLPELHLTFDWVTRRLRGRSGKRMQYEIQLLNPENEPVITPWKVKYQEGFYDQETSVLETVLKQGSLVRVAGINSNTERKFREHRIMIQQVGWTHKPIDLPQLTSEQILAIYAGMSPEHRQMMVLNSFIKNLIRQNIGGEITATDHEQTDSEFFCEYAEIFYAFRILRKRLQTALENEDYAKVDYYLTGTGVDSLPALIDQACDEELPTFDGVTAYLLLLCAIETYNLLKLNERPNVHSHLENANTTLNKLKHGVGIKLENDSRERRASFFDWFEKQFHQEYVELEGLQDTLEVEEE